LTFSSLALLTLKMSFSISRSSLLNFFNRVLFLLTLH
jgi:hypothetical protein